MHTANTTMSNFIPSAQRLELGAGDVVLMASPMAHQTGFMYGLMMPIMLKAHAVLQDIWDPAKAIDLIRAHEVSFTMASTPFLTDLAHAVAEQRGSVPSLRVFLCAGAPIPGPLVEQARAALGAKVVSAWGMTENGAVTTTRLEDDDARSFTTDGLPLPGVEIRIVDADGQPVASGTPGRLLLRSCPNFGASLLRPQLNGPDADGCFDTVHLPRLDDPGYLRITAPSQAVIIRGGDTIPTDTIQTPA